jgi:O-antigen/teichoic acid export membrane protein
MLRLELPSHVRANDATRADTGRSGSEAKCADILPCWNRRIHRLATAAAEFDDGPLILSVQAKEPEGGAGPAPALSSIIDSSMGDGTAQRTRSATSDTVESFLLKVVLYAIGFGASVLISRGLGPAGRGIYYLPIVTAATVASFATLGLEQANVFLFGSRSIPIDRLWGQGGLVALVVGSLGGLLLVAAPSLLPETFGSAPAPLWWMAAAGLPLTLHSQFASGLLTLRGQVTWQFRAGLIGAVIQTIALFALYGLGQFTPFAVVATSVGSNIVVWALVVIRLAREGRWVRWDLALLKETLARSLVLHAAMVLLFLHLRVDMFMLNNMAGPAVLGLYSLSVTLAETVMLGTDSVAIAILPRQMGNSLEEAALMALRAARIAALISAGFIAAWAIVGFPLIVFAFGKPYAGSYLPLLVLLPGVAFMGMQRVCGGPVLRAGRPSRIVWINVLSLAANVVLNLWWIPIWGATGAAAASSCSYAFGATLFLRWTAGMGAAAFPGSVLPRVADATAAWAGFAALVRSRTA